MSAFLVKFRFPTQVIRLLNSSVFVPILVLVALLIAGRPSPAMAEDIYGFNLTQATFAEWDGTSVTRATGTDTAFGLALGGWSSVSGLAGSTSAESQNGNAYGVYVYDNSTLLNRGAVSGSTTGGTVYGAYTSASTLTNMGTITGTGTIRPSHGVYAFLSSITNSGTITGTSTSGRGVGAWLSTSTLSNTGSIFGTASSSFAYGVLLFSSATATNSGTITGTSTSGTAYGVYLDSSTSLSNFGTITGVGNRAYGVNTGGFSTIANTGTISASGANAAEGVYVDFDSTLTNSGLISATSTTSDAYGVRFDVVSFGSSGTLTNTGSISAHGATNSYAVFASDYATVNLDTGTRILSGSVYSDDSTSNLNIRSDSDLGFTLGGNWDTITNSGSGLWSLNGATSATAFDLNLNSGSKTIMETGSRLTATTLNLNSGASLDFEKNSLMTVTGTATLNGAISVDASANNLGSGTYLTAGTLNTGADYSAVASNPNFSVNVTTTTGAGGSVSVSTAFAPQDDATSLAASTVLSSSQAFAGVAQARNIGLLADRSDEDREIVVASVGSLDGLLNTRKEETPWGVYLQPVYSFGSRNGSASSKGYTFDMYGLEAGLDLRIGDDGVVGVMAGYGASHMDFTGSSWVSDDNEDQLLYTAGAYAGYRAGDWTFADTLSVAYADHESERKASATDIATANYTSWLTNNEFLALYHWSPSENWLITPRAGLNVTYLHRPGFSESGSVNALTYQTLNQFFSEGLVGVNVQRTFVKDELTVTPYMGLGAVHSLTGSDITVKQYLSTTSAEVTTKNDDSRFTGELGMAFNTVGTTVTLGYTGEYSKSSDSHSVFGQLRREF